MLGIGKSKEEKAAEKAKKEAKIDKKVTKELQKQTDKNQKVIKKLGAEGALYAIEANLIEKGKVLGNKSRKSTMVFFEDRIEIIKKGFLSGNKGNKTFYYDEISHIDFLKSMIQKPTIIIQVNSVKHEFYVKTSKELAEKIAAEIKSKARESRITTASSAPAEKDKFQQLKELGELKDAGILSEEEFQTEKQKILSQ